VASNQLNYGPDLKQLGLLHTSWLHLLNFSNISCMWTKARPLTIQTVLTEVKACLGLKIPGSIPHRTVNSIHTRLTIPWTMDMQFTSLQVCSPIDVEKDD